VGQRHIQRLRRAEGLRVPPTKRKIIRRGVSTGLPTTATHRNHVWTWDFIADATVRGGTLKLLTILDEHTRECHVLWAERALKAADVLHWLQKAVEQHGAPDLTLSRTIPSWYSGNFYNFPARVARGLRQFLFALSVLMFTRLSSAQPLTPGTLKTNSSVTFAARW